ATTLVQPAVNNTLSATVHPNTAGSRHCQFARTSTTALIAMTNDVSVSTHAAAHDNRRPPAVRMAPGWQSTPANASGQPLAATEHVAGQPRCPPPPPPHMVLAWPRSPHLPPKPHRTHELCRGPAHTEALLPRSSSQ